jgi:hypothetical protein
MIIPLPPGGSTGKLGVIQVGIEATFCQKLSEDKAPINFNTASNHYHYKGGRTTNAYLQLVETANKQKKGVRWAKEYEL